jgi:hypothetical protein
MTWGWCALEACGQTQTAIGTLGAAHGAVGLTVRGDGSKTGYTCNCGGDIVDEMVIEEWSNGTWVGLVATSGDGVYSGTYKIVASGSDLTGYLWDGGEWVEKCSGSDSTLTGIRTGINSRQYNGTYATPNTVDAFSVETA